jgi:hypothetical protein
MAVGHADLAGFGSEQCAIGTDEIRKVKSLKNFERLFANGGGNATGEFLDIAAQDFLCPCLRDAHAGPDPWRAGHGGVAIANRPDAGGIAIGLQTQALETADQRKRRRADAGRRASVIAYAGIHWVCFPIPLTRKNARSPAAINGQWFCSAAHLIPSCKQRH